MIYAIQARSGGPIKIGFSLKSPRQRLLGCRVGNHEDLVLLAHCDGGQFEEKCFHRILHKYRIRGEWFSPSELVMDAVMAMSSGEFDFDNCFNRHVKSEREIEREIRGHVERLVYRALRKHNDAVIPAAKWLHSIGEEYASDKVVEIGTGAMLGWPWRVEDFDVTTERYSRKNYNLYKTKYLNACRHR